MTKTFYFYDLETSGRRPQNARVMQFAGQRTDLDLRPIGPPDNFLVKLPEDVLPDPEAILVHQITPQKTLQEGFSEDQFAEKFNQIAQPGTIFVGYNNIRFDDEFMRRVMFRNFYDPYQWHWKDGRSRWDLLDVMRMTRALRPEGIKWPELEGKPTVKLELLAKQNNLLHQKAHDALSDVQALIALAKLLRSAQPKLFDYLLEMRNPEKVQQLVDSNQPFVYSSGRYADQYLKTNPVLRVCRHPQRKAAVVYDLRQDPARWLKLQPQELVKHWQARRDDDLEPAPLKILQFNRCPAVAPLSVLQKPSQQRLDIDLDLVQSRSKKILSDPNFAQNCSQALDILEEQKDFPVSEYPDRQIYQGGFYNAPAYRDLELLRGNKQDLNAVAEQVKTPKIRGLIPFYIARNYPEQLTDQQRSWWEEYRQKIFYAGGQNSLINDFSKRLSGLAATAKDDQYLLTELQLYVEAILPEPSEQ